MEPRLPPPFWVLWAGTLINMIGGMVEAFLALYLYQVLGFSVARAGAVVAMLGLGAILAQFIGGILADRIGRRATILISTTAQAGFVLLLAQSHGAMVFVAAGLVGLTREMYRPAVIAVIADLVPAAQQVRAHGLIYWAINLGWSAALALGGFLAEWNFLWVFYADAVSCLIFAVIVWAGVSETATAAPAGILRGKALAGLGDRVLLAYLAIVMVYTMLTLQGMTTLPLVMRSLGLSSSTYGLVMALNGVVVIVAQPLISRLVRKWNSSRALFCSYLIVGGGYGLTAFASTGIGIAVTVAIWTIGEVMAAGTLPALITSLAPDSDRGRYSGFYGAAWSVGLLLAPLVGTQLLKVSAGLLWGSCVALGIVLVVAQSVVDRVARRRAALYAPQTVKG